MVLFVCPWTENPATGGFRYNREIARRIDPARLRYTLVGGQGGSKPESYTVQIKESPPDDTDMVVLDSLFFLDPDFGLEIVRKAGVHYGMVVHYLPSLDPTRSEAERSNLAAEEDRLISAAAGIVATGSRTVGEVRRRFPAVRVDLVPPGISRRGGAPEDGTKDGTRGAKGEGGAPRDRGRRDWEPRDDDEVRLVTVSNLIPLKGIDKLVPILGKIENRAWRWTVYGDTAADPDYTNRLRRSIAEAGLEGKIRLAGRIDPEKVVNILESSDVFVFPSLSESYGMAAAEALGAGLPVIMNDTGEVERLIENGREGFVCPLKGNDLDVRVWGETLSLILDNPELRSNLASGARAAALPLWDDAARDFWEAVRSWTR
jgi:glycosyltransferase involved in cell wall biosynthesis